MIKNLNYPLFKLAWPTIFKINLYDVSICNHVSTVKIVRCLNLKLFGAFNLESHIYVYTEINCFNCF